MCYAGFMVACSRRLEALLKYIQTELNKRKSALILNAFIVVIVLDIINNFLLHWSWFSIITICLYIVFIILFIREIMKKKTIIGNI